MSSNLKCPFFDIKKILFVFVLGFPVFIFGQSFSEKKQARLDSLNRIITDPNSTDTSLVHSYIVLSELLFSSNIDTVIPLCKKALEIGEDALERNTSTVVENELMKYIALAYNNIGFINKKKGNSAVAIHNYEKALSIQESIGDEKQFSVSLNNIGSYFYQQGQREKALSYFIRAMAIQIEIGNTKELAYTYNNIGNVYKQVGDIPLAVKYYHKSLDIKKEINDQEGVATAFNNLGLLFKNQKDFAKALSYYEKSLEINSENGFLDGKAYALHNIGSLLRVQGDLALSLEYFNQSLLIRTELGDKEGISNTLIQIAKILFDKEDYESAELNVKKSLMICREIGDREYIAYGLRMLGDICFENERYSEAKIKGLESLKLAEEIGYPRLISDASGLLVKVYEQENNGMKALQMHRLFVKMRDSVMNIETARITANEFAKYQYENKKKQDDLQHDIEIAIKDEKIKSKQSITNLLIILLCVVAISLVIIVERLIKINRLKLKLLNKNTENEELVANLESTVEERTLTLKQSFKLLEEKEKNYGDLLDKSSEMIQMLDPEGKITYVNQAWLENMKFNKLEEVIGKPIVEFFNNSTLKEFQLVMPKLMRGELVEDLECQFISNENSEITLKGRARPILKDGNYSGSQAFFFNITEVLRTKREMDQMTSFKEIMLNITTEYINAPISEIDNVINASLLEIAKFSSADRAYVFKYNFDEEICSFTHEWVAEGVPSQLEELKAMPFSKVPHSLKKHSKGEFVEFPDVSKIKDKRIFNVLKEEGTQSMISIPMMHNDKAIGFIGFDIMKTKREFTADEKNLLRIYSQMLVNVFNRIAFIEELQTTKNELAEINLSLEKKVFENTKKNMDLSRSIMEQEKLVTIGEISAGIAHDLNTPLGTIRVGADNINFILSSLFNGSICDFTKEELSHILNHVEKNRIEMYVGGLQMRKEKSAMLEYLNASISGKIPDTLAEICDLLVKCRFNPSQEQEISIILSKPLAKEYLQVMNQLQMAMAQLETIRKSSDKAVGVVQDMRAFIKGENVLERKMINLRDNISTVLGVFNYEISLHVNLIFEVDSSIEFMGYDIKLFQLWSNIVKNGLEAMSDQKDRYFGIFAERKDDQLKVVFENNGPKIPDEIAETIFKKFYTTKAKKSGSGLGLTIVKNVLKEHQADIIVESRENLTKFIITFEL
tara:strand:- start:538 stop:4086 length:3549 start_codon:yes stop_codon:yes gene_type:complete